MKIWQVALSVVVGLVVFVGVLSGAIEATGAAPGGVLTGRGALPASIVSHALIGALTTWLVFFGWSGCLAFVLALAGVFRHRLPWFTPLLWIALAVGAEIGHFAILAVHNWLGSVSPGVWDGAHTWYPPFWDAAAFWGASAVVGTVLLVTAPVFVRALWNWSNGGSFGDGVVWLRVPVYSVALALATAPLVIIWAVISSLLTLFGGRPRG